jgi:hypothetical protein
MVSRSRAESLIEAAVATGVTSTLVARAIGMSMVTDTGRPAMTVAMTVG